MEQAMHLIPWATIGPSGLLALTVISIIQGWLVPGRMYEQMRSDRDYWRQAAERREQQLHTVLSESVRTSTAVIDSLPTVHEAGEHP